jgi:hypothetical protein
LVEESEDLSFSLNNLSTDKILSDFSSSMVITALNNQLNDLEKQKLDNKDFLTPFLKRIDLAKRLDISEEGKSALELAKNSILLLVTNAIEKNLEIDLSEHDLNPENGNYENDIQELYNFTIKDRKEIAIKFLENIIIMNRKIFSTNLYRIEIDKKDQTISNVRKLFSNYDDVVVWCNIEKILKEFQDGLEFTFSLEQFLEVVGDSIGIPSDGFIDNLSGTLEEVNFSKLFLTPVLTNEEFTNTKIKIQERWIQVCKNRYNKKSE